MGVSSNQTIGYWYEMGLQFGICHGPVDTVHKILVGERAIKRILIEDEEAWFTPISESGDINVDEEELFGGEKREGGLVGDLSMAFGEISQTPNPYLQEVLGDDIPAYRGILSAIWEGGKLSAMSPYIKKWEFIVSRAAPPIIAGAAWKTIGDDDANPAYIVYECLTNEVWGMGYPTASMDDSSFLATAETLFDEGFGLSIAWATQVSIEDFVQVIVDHIAGQLRFNLTTGLYEFHLIRKVSDLSGVPTLDEDVIVEVISFERQGWGETTNEVTVKYTDPDTFKETAVTVHDLGNITMQGSVLTQTLDFYGIRSPDLAQKVAIRELTARATPLATINLKINKKAWDLRPGDVFKFTWPPLGIEGMACRCVTLEAGEADSGFISLMAVEDVFYMDSTAYTEQEPIGWVDPLIGPAPSPFEVFIETPYWLLIGRLNAADYALLTDTDCFVTAVSAAPDGVSYGFDVVTGVVGGPYTYTVSGDSSPYGVLGTSLQKEVTSVLTLSSSVNLSSIEIDSIAMIGTEMCQVTAVTPPLNEISLTRAIGDTVPQLHAIGSYIVFMVDTFSAISTEEFVLLETVAGKVLPKTGLGILAEDDAAELSVDMVERRDKPYRPGNLTIGGYYFSTKVAGETVAFQWAARNRLQEQGDILPYTGSIASEPGVNYVVKIMGEGGSVILDDGDFEDLIFNVTSTNDASQTSAGAVSRDVIDDTGSVVVQSDTTRMSDTYSIELESIRYNTVKSFQQTTHTLDHSGYGLRYGEYYGG